MGYTSLFSGSFWDTAQETVFTISSDVAYTHYSLENHFFFSERLRLGRILTTAYLCYFMCFR